jgi:hypothetical protein
MRECEGQDCEAKQHREQGHSSQMTLVPGNPGGHGAERRRQARNSYEYDTGAIYEGTPC